MNDLRATFEDAVEHIDVDLGAAVLSETRRRRRRNRALTVAGAMAFVVLISAGASQMGGFLDRQPRGPMDAPTSKSTPEEPSPDASGPATQPVWDPFAAAEAPRSDASLSALLPGVGALRPAIAPGANPVREDPMTGVVVAWSEKGAGTRLLGPDGRWRSAPAGFESNEGTPYPADPPALSADGTQLAIALRTGVTLLDVTTGKSTVLEWPDELAPPWDWAPELRWLPGDRGLLVRYLQQPWVIELDGDARPLGYDDETSSGDEYGVDPNGSIYQNDYRRNVLVTWEDDRAVREVPFPQCERLVAADGLVACTSGSLDNGPSGYPRSGPVVVEAATGEIVGYAPIDDESSLYSDNGNLTALGFLDPETVLLEVRPRRAGAQRPSTSTYLLAWDYADGTFERIATSDPPPAGDYSVAPALVG